MNCDYYNISKAGNSESLLEFLNDKLKEFPQILDRDFEIFKQNDDNDQMTFRVMQWNTLAKSLCEPNKYTKTPKEAYDWDNYRIWRTIQEIARYDCDIVCLEEADHYELIKPYLHSIGYTSIFMPKYASPCLEMLNNIGPDGSCIFYRLSKFQIVNMSCEKVITNGEINPQVFIILQLKHLATNNLLTVMAIHLKSKVGYHERRCSQIKFILDKFKLHLEGSTFNVKKHALLLCGDFNGEPFEEFHNVIINDMDLCLRDAYTFANQVKEPTTIKLRSSNGEMIKRGIDYIFYNSAVLQLRSYLKLPKNNKLIDEQGLPNLIYSSDHLSLVCDFKFIR